MIQKHTQRTDNAVSPVVGVMLMLVVTIIIAAVVAAFATGVISTTEKTPQMILKGTYSQTGGMTITHAGGDAVVLASTNFMTTPSEQMGADANKYAYIVSKDVIFFNGVNLTNASAPTTFNGGDSFYIPTVFCYDNLNVNTVDFTKEPWKKLNETIGAYKDGNKLKNTGKMVNANAQQFWTSENDEKVKAFQPYEFMYNKNVGKYFYLDLVDKTGSVISRAKVIIEG